MTNTVKEQFNQIHIDATYDENLKGKSLNVLLALIQNFNVEKGFAYPSMQYLADNLKCSVRTIKRIIKKLAEIGYITISKRKGKAGNYNAYSNIRYMISKVIKKKSKKENDVRSKEIEEKEEDKRNKGFTVAGKLIGCNVINKEEGEEENRIDNKDKINNHPNVRLAREATDIDSNYVAKIAFYMADEEMAREAVREFKYKNGRSATFLLDKLIDAYFEYGIKMSDKMINFIQKGTKGNVTINQDFIPTSENREVFIW